MSTYERSRDITSDDSNDAVKPKEPVCTILEQNDAGLKCALCHSSANDPLNYGEMYQIDNLVSHYFCLLFSSSLVQNGADDEGIQGFFPKDIQKEIRRGSRLKCSYCRKTGATIGCHLKSCKKTFHLPCGLKNDSMHQFFDQFLSFCSGHRPHQKVDAKCIKAAEEDEDALTCPICYESVPNKVSNETLWAPCCKKRWFHRCCVQRQARAQGYFFKCPMCNNKKEFNAEMKKFGIYNPEMDAAWEREPNAFQDLLQTYRHCDACLCKCPDGRNFVQNTGSWRLLRCNCCGSQGTHIVCSGVKIAAASNSWRCSLCSEVIAKANLEPPVSEPSSVIHPTTNTTVSSSSTTLPSTNSSQRRPADSIQVSQTIKRRRENSQIEILGNLSAATSSVQASTSLPAGRSVNEKGTRADMLPGSSDDEIIVVDDSESDIEVLDEVSVKEPILSSRTSGRCTVSASQFADRELLTKDGKKIKVHNVTAAGGDSVRGEVGNLGVVRINQPKGTAVTKKDFSVKDQKSNCAASTSKSPFSPKNDLISRPSTSKDHSLPVISSVCTISRVGSVGSSSSSLRPAANLDIKTDNDHHSSKSCFSSRAEDGVRAGPSGAPAPAVTITGTSGLQMPFTSRGNTLMNFAPQVFFVPVKTADGQDVLQPMSFQIPMLGPPQQQRLLQLPPRQQQPQQPHQQQQSQNSHQQSTLEKDRSSPDIVTLD